MPADGVDMTHTPPVSRPSLRDRHASAPLGARLSFWTLTALGAAWFATQLAATDLPTGWGWLVLHALVGYLGFDTGLAVLRRKRVGRGAGRLLAVSLGAASGFALASSPTSLDAGNVAVLVLAAASLAALSAPSTKAWFADSEPVLAPILRTPAR